MRGHCSFCWYWWYYWLLLFKLFFSKWNVEKITGIDNCEGDNIISFMSQAKLGGTNTSIYHVKPYTKMSYFDQMICNTKKIHFVCNCQLTLPVHLSSPPGLSEFRVLNQLFIIFLLTSALSVLLRITVPPWYLQCFLKTIEKKRVYDNPKAMLFNKGS